MSGGIGKHLQAESESVLRLNVDSRRTEDKYVQRGAGGGTERRIHAINSESLFLSLSACLHLPPLSVSPAVCLAQTTTNLPMTKQRRQVRTTKLLY